MAKIKLKEPDGPYSCILNTEVMQIELRDVFLGVRFIADSGEELSVNMRDSGFEIFYYSDPKKPTVYEIVELKNGIVGLCSCKE